MTVKSEIQSLDSLLEELTVSGKHNSTSYRLLKTAVSKLREFEKLNTADSNKNKQSSLF